jgi:hypothetical protein
MLKGMDAIPRDTSVFGDTSGEPTAFPVDKFHGPDYLVKHGCDSVLFKNFHGIIVFHLIEKWPLIFFVKLKRRLPPQGSNILFPGLPLHSFHLSFICRRLQQISI